MKIENKLEGASKYRTLKKRIYLMLVKHKDLDFIQPKVKNPTDDAGKEKPRNQHLGHESDSIWTEGKSNPIYIQYRF